MKLQIECNDINIKIYAMTFKVSKAFFFGHAFSKAYQYGIPKKKIAKISNMFPLCLSNLICKSA
jgi:hypothetical protein